MSERLGTMASISQIAGITTCRHCDKKFVGPAGLLITADNRNAGRVAQLAIKLLEHLQKDHAQIFAAAALAGMQMNSLAVMSNFATTDQEFTHERDKLRWEIHQRTLAASFTDESLSAAADIAAEELANDLAEVDDREFKRKVAEVVLREFKTIRNALQEPEPPKLGF